MRFTRDMILRAVLAALLHAVPAAAQTPAAEKTATTEETSTAATTSSKSDAAGVQTATTTAEETYDSQAVRAELIELLRRHPQNVGTLLKLDPTLFHNEQWMATYPALQTYVKAHPEIAQNPSYFLDEVSLPSDYHPDPPAVRAAQEMMQGIFIFITISLVTTALMWLIRTLLEYRRWSRISRVQTELHNKLLDRFTSHEDLLRYVQSAAGKQFLESATAASPHVAAPPVAAPISRVLLSVQVGVVMAALGVGGLLASMGAHPDVAQVFSSFATIAICAGLGFVVAGIASYVLARRLGLWPEPAGRVEANEPAQV